MIKALFRLPILLFVIAALLLSIYYLWKNGVDQTQAFLDMLVKWLKGGSYSGFAVMSVAFAMNTWGLAVKSMRQRVRRDCKIRISRLINELRTGPYLDAIDKGAARMKIGFWPSVWFKVVSWSISRYKSMLPKMLEISAAYAEFFMGLSAVISVCCMICDMNGRFAAFLLLPYPIFWCYCRLALLWMRFLLEAPMFLLKSTWIGCDVSYEYSNICSFLEEGKSIVLARKD